MRKPCFRDINTARVSLSNNTKRAYNIVGRVSRDYYSAARRRRISGLSTREIRIEPPVESGANRRNHRSDYG